MGVALDVTVFVSVCSMSLSLGNSSVCVFQGSEMTVNHGTPPSVRCLARGLGL